jgi:hypothetical protein
VDGVIIQLAIRPTTVNLILTRKFNVSYFSRGLKVRIASGPMACVLAKTLCISKQGLAERSGTLS